MLNSIKTIFGNAVQQRGTILKDLKLVLKHAITIPNIYLPLQAINPKVRSELNPNSYTFKNDWLKIIRQALIPTRRQSLSEGNLICYPDHFVEEAKPSKWFFINGMLTAPQIACLNGKELASIFGRPINLIHTPTDGAIKDFLDSFVARTLRKDGSLSQPAYKVIKRALQTHNHVVIICHSQGTIVGSYIVRKLQKDPETRKLLHKLEFYCFAGVADSFKLDMKESCERRRPVPYVEHFVNTKDFFARIGILAHQRSTEGPIFTASKSGHFFNAHYLSNFLKGSYCQGRSRLYQYLAGQSPEENQFCETSKNAHEAP